MAIYVRNNDGAMSPLKIPAIQGRSAYQVACDNGFKGTEKEWLDSLKGGGSTSIDDISLSTEKTWSSSKIENFVLNNDNAVWLDQSKENLKIDSAKEGYLREIEIWGNTIQNEEDLSDIKHLGELYVDEDGEPILDDLGREQYKIEIKINNGILWEGNYSVKVIPNMETGHLIEDTNGGYGASDYIEIGEGFNLRLNVVRHFFFFDKDKKPIIPQIRNNVATTPKNTRYVRIADYNTIGQKNEYLKIEGVTETIKKSHKTTILLPCQLMKIGDVADRLYWDSEKGRYVIEKKINMANIPYTSKFTRKQDNNTCVAYMTSRTVMTGMKTSTGNFTNFINSITLPGAFYSNDKEGCGTSSLWGANIAFSVLKSRLSSDTIEGFAEFITPNGIDICYELKEYQYIETNITEQIKLPTYINTTYVTVNGGISGSIKCKAPVDGSAAINSLVQENKELKAINEEQDEVINISLMATDEIFMMLEPLLDIATLSNENATSKIADMYKVMVNKGLKKIEEVPQRYRQE